MALDRLVVEMTNLSAGQKKTEKRFTTQPAFTCSKSKIETPKQYMKSVQS